MGTDRIDPAYQPESIDETVQLATGEAGIEDDSDRLWGPEEAPEAAK